MWNGPVFKGMCDSADCAYLLYCNRFCSGSYLKDPKYRAHQHSRKLRPRPSPVYPCPRRNLEKRLCWFCAAYETAVHALGPRMFEEYIRGIGAPASYLGVLVHILYTESRVTRDAGGTGGKWQRDRTIDNVERRPGARYGRTVSP